MILVEVTDTLGQKALLGRRMVTLAQGNNLPLLGTWIFHRKEARIPVPWKSAAGL